MTERRRTLPVPYVGLELPAVPASVAVARARIRAFARGLGADAELQASVVLAVSEAVTNAVVHAYRDVPPGSVRLDADYEGDDLEITVTDDGCGFTGEPSPGLGFGFLHMREDTSDFQIRDRPDGGVEVWMRFPVAAV